jgi:hypothetical protein
MTHLKSILIKQLCSKFKVSYVLSLCLLLSLSSCTSEEVDEAIWVFVLIGMVWKILLPMAVVYAILFAFQVLRFLYYTHRSNQEIKENEQVFESKEEIVSITKAYQAKKTNLLVLLYFIAGVLPFCIFALFLIIACWQYGPLTWIFALGTGGILFAIAVLHLGGTYMVLIMANSPPRLIVKKMTRKFLPKDLLNQLQRDKAFSKYTIKAVKNELIIQPKKFSFGRVLVIQCISKEKEKYVYLLEASAHTTNSIGFETNKEIIDRIVKLEMQ